MRVDNEREANPSEAIIDSQSVKRAAMVSDEVRWDGGKLIQGCKGFLPVDTLGLVLRVWVTVANVGERERVKQMGASGCRVCISLGWIAALMGSRS